MQGGCQVLDLGRLTLGGALGNEVSNRATGSAGLHSDEAAEVDEW